MRRFLLCTSALVLVGCASLNKPKMPMLKIPQVDLPLQTIQKSVLSQFPGGGLRTTSPNGREFLSKHFIVEKDMVFKLAADATSRYYAHVIMLNDRRPYDLELTVVREKRVMQADGQYTYVVTGYDLRLAKELEKRIQKELTKRREDRNIIDDFRVF